MRDELTSSFWSKVKKKRTGRWVWMGRRDKDGYGIGSNGQRAHRLAFELHNGPIPKGNKIRRKCHNRRCVRPDHLALGSDYENALDTYQSGRPMHWKQRKIAEFGLRAEKKYGQTAKAKRRARANYKAWKRRADKRAAYNADQLMLRNLVSIEGMLHLTDKDGQQVTIPLGGRALFYEHIADDGPTIKRPRAPFDPQQMRRRQQHLRTYEEFVTSIGATVLGD